MGKRILIFSDGTGQRGVRKDGRTTNVYLMYEAALAADKSQYCFYDPGLGSDERGFHKRLYAKTTGFGISLNIQECYEYIIKHYSEGAVLGFFGFSRGAYTVRSLGGVLSNCGIPRTNPAGVQLGANAVESDELRDLRAEIAAEAVKIYQTSNSTERKRKAAEFRKTYSCDDAVPDVIGVFDTVESLGAPGITNVLNPFRHHFHDTELNPRTRFGFQALAVDENRYMFQPVLWDESKRPETQTIEQVWFPGVHSDIGGGYRDRGLSDFTLQWMVRRCESTGLELRFDYEKLDWNTAAIEAPHNNERTGFGRLWLPKDRSEFVVCENRDNSRLCDPIENRFNADPQYRPEPLRHHHRVRNFYATAPSAFALTPQTSQ